MTSNQENKLTMWKAALMLLSNYDTVWTGFAPFADTVSALQTKYDEVSVQRNLQATAIKGTTKLKSQLRNEAIDIVLPLCGALQVYAKSIDDLDLAENARNTYSSISSLRDTILVMELNRMHSLLSANLAGLAPYNVTATQLTALQVATTKYSDVVASPRVRLTQKVSATNAIVTLLEEGTALFKDLDALALQYKFSNSVFYSEYTKSRKIINLGHRYTSLSLIGSMDEDADKLKGVDVVLSNANTTYISRLGTDGIVYFDSVRPGTYSLEINSDTMAFDVVTVKVKSGVSNTINVTLKAV